MTFKGNSDTEVFLYGFIYFGVDEFLRLADGMFAAAIFDKKTKRLFLVRDRVGEKPLFYFINSKGYFLHQNKKVSPKMLRSQLKLLLLGYSYTLFYDMSQHPTQF